MVGLLEGEGGNLLRNKRAKWTIPTGCSLNLKIINYNLFIY